MTVSMLAAAAAALRTNSQSVWISLKDGSFLPLQLRGSCELISRMFVGTPISVYRPVSWLVNPGSGLFSGGTRDGSPLSLSRFPHFLPQGLTSGWCLEEGAVSRDGAPGSAGAPLPP